MATTKELLEARFSELKAELAELQEGTKPLREERDAYLLQIETLNARVQELTAMIRAAEDGRVFTLSREIATLAGALGGYSLARGE